MIKEKPPTTTQSNSQKFNKDSIGYMNVNGDGTLTAASADTSLVALAETNVPTLEIEGLPFHENYYTSRGQTYDVPTLVAFAKYKGYVPFDLPLVGIDMSHMPFTVNTFIQLLYQLKRITDTNLDYPVLLDEEGTICDGWHRVAKAFLEGRKTIKAIRLLEMPEASGKVTTN